LRSYQQNPDVATQKFPDFYIKRDIDKLSEDYKPVAQLLLDYANEEDEDKSQIRIHVYGQGDTTQFLHAKCYIFLGTGYANGVIGSSNFTEKGLQDNAELNYLETQNSVVTAPFTEYSDSKSHKVWFEEMWNNSEPWTGKFIREILKASPVGKAVEEEKKQVAENENSPLTPYELYIKLLQLRFGDLVGKDRSAAIASYLPESYHKLEYQLTAVKQCYSIMKTHGGFMLADVVGLGKTVVGTLLIKFFLDMPDDRIRRVLIITPPAIESSWRETIDEFDEGIADKIKQNVDFITTGSLGNLVDDVDWSEDDDDDNGEFNGEFKNENYGLIIIDESHKFRNSSTQMYKKLDQLISNIGSDTGVYPYIGLLSATPQNNTPADLKNQIYLFERNHKNCSLDKVPGFNLENYFANICSKYDDLRIEAGTLRALIEEEPHKKSELEEVNKQLIELSQDVRDKVLTDILVRRTRTDIMKFYADDVRTENIVFPQIVGPCELTYKMSDSLANLFVDTMNLICTSQNDAFDNPNYICYYRYQAIKFIKNEEIAKSYHYRNMTPERFSQQLAKIMQMLLVKRLESSFAAFKSSLHNLRTYTQNMIDMWNNDTIFICPDIDVNGELDVYKLQRKDESKPILTFAQCVEDIRKKIHALNDKKKNEKGRNAEFHRADFDSDYLDKLRHDYAIINQLCERWDKNVDDPKFDKFKESLLPVLLSPDRNPYKKLVIFTEAKDTLNSLVTACKAKGLKVLAISAENRRQMESVIKANFDANFKGEWKNDFDVIVTTEVLAEGINLHRANSILNYDTPWNSTKLMQRIGRVNRIGSKASHIYVYNFMPSAQGDKLINLVQRAYTKLQSFHSLFGEDSKIFTEEETLVHHDLNTVVNGEESPLEKYLQELRDYKNLNPERYLWIENQSDSMSLSTGNDGCAYFVVKTPKTNGLFVRVTSEFKASVIPAIEMFKQFYSAPDVTAIELPDDWDKYKKAACKKLTQHLNAIARDDSNRERRATTAKSIVTGLTDSLRARNELPSELEVLLNNAFDYADSGNNDIINRLISIGNELDNRGNTLFDITLEEITSIIRNGIGYIENRQIETDGKPEVYIGLKR
jgi:superfamily II DNA/RNA helicase